MYENVINSIEKNIDPYVTAEDGRNALELVLAIYMSAKNKKPVKLPIKVGSTIGLSIDFTRR